MGSFLSLHLGTILVGLLILIGATGAVLSLIRSKKKGKCLGCDCSCDSCPMGGEGNR